MSKRATRAVAKTAKGRGAPRKGPAGRAAKKSVSTAKSRTAKTRIKKAVTKSARLASSVPDLPTIEQFLFHEARLLDERRLDAWRDLFTEDGLYWMPTQHNQTSTDEVVSIYLDDRSVMASRIKRLRHPDAHIQVPISHTAHLVSNIEVEPTLDANGDIVVHAVFLMTEYRRDAPRWLSGRYRYLLARSGDALRIRMKKVMLINCDAALPAMAIYA